MLLFYFFGSAIRVPRIIRLTQKSGFLRDWQEIHLTKTETVSEEFQNK